MPTTKITVVVSRSNLKCKSSVADTKVKKSSDKPVDDKSFYEKAVEAVYGEIDVLRTIGLTYLLLLPLMTVLFQHRISRLKRLKKATMITGDKPKRIIFLISGGIYYEQN